MKMSLNIVGLALVLCFGLTGLQAQDDSTAPSSDTQGASQQSPVPAYGQDTSSTPMSENPPLSGLDLPSLEPHAAPLSYIQPGATLNQSLDTNAGNTIGGSSAASITRALGSLALHRIWSHYDLALDYAGGVGYYNLQNQGFKNLQQMDVVQRVNWKRGSLSVRDSFSYLPEGNFGGAYGSLGSEGVQVLGSTAFGAFWGGNALGALGLTPRIMNVSLAELQESLTPKSSVTATGGYALTHFLGNDITGTSFIGSSQVSAQAGYNRILTPHTQMAFVYGYQGYDFSVYGTAFHTHVIQVLYGHRISGRMDLLAGAGPQLTFIDTQAAVCSNPSIPLVACQPPDTVGIGITKQTKPNVAAQARLRYQLPKASLSLNYERFQTSGSGLFAGAESDIVRFTASRPLSRVWNVFADMGFTHNVRTQPLTPAQFDACGSKSQGSQNACPANFATSYNYGFIGGGLHRSFGRTLHGFLSYQFNELAFDHSYCLTSAACSRISNRQIFSLGLDWTPRPIRID